MKTHQALGIILFAIIMYFIWQPLFMWAAGESTVVIEVSR